MLLASICDKGRCPCPRCLIPLNQVERLGTVDDIKKRKTLARVDNMAKQDKVLKARNLIYEGNAAVDNNEVEKLLKDESLVPTKVCPILSNSGMIFTDER